MRELIFTATASTMLVGCPTPLNEQARDSETDIRVERTRETANNAGPTKPVLLPEANYRVTLSASIVSCIHPDGTAKSISWDSLERVEVRTTDLGPLETDVFWVLHDKNGPACVVPQGATGEDALLNRLQTLPGFDNFAVINAMGSTENATFLCWTRK